MLQTVARGTYFGSPGAGAEEGQPLRLRHRSSAARGEPSGAQRSRETAARIRPGCRAHAARRKRHMGEAAGPPFSALEYFEAQRTLLEFSGLARRGGEPNVDCDRGSMILMVQSSQSMAGARTVRGRLMHEEQLSPSSIFLVTLVSM